MGELLIDETNVLGHLHVHKHKNTQTVPNTQKTRNLRQNCSTTLMLDDTKNGSDVVILEGSAELLGRGEEREAIQAYGEKYYEGLQRIGVTADQFTMLYSQPIRITPTRLMTGQ